VGGRERGGKRERERECVCVCVCGRSVYDTNTAQKGTNWPLEEETRTSCAKRSDGKETVLILGDAWLTFSIWMFTRPMVARTGKNTPLRREKERKGEREREGEREERERGRERERERERVREMEGREREYE
jgi:hypothetical protein